MPHRCMNCGQVYEDDSDELLDGCSCGSSLFMYEGDGSDGSEAQVEEAEETVRRAIEDGFEDTEEVSFKFDLDSIVVEEEGVYTINVSRLLEEMPLVVKRSEGSYHVHLPSAFNGKNRSVESEYLTDG